MKFGKKVIQISFDINDDRPGKALRIYDTTGNAIGFGEMVVKKTDPELNLLDSKPGYITYAASIDLDKMIEKEKEVENRKVKTVTKIEESDVEDTNDPEEDNWVRGSLKQLKDAKAAVNLETVATLRNDYRLMMKARASHSPIKESEGNRSYSYPTEVEEHNGFLVRQENIKLSNSADSIKPKITFEDDLYSKEEIDGFKQTELPEPLKKVINEVGDSILAERKVWTNTTCYGNMPQEFIGDAVKEAEWEKQQVIERKKLAETNTAKFQERMKETYKEKETNISLDDL